MIKAIRSDHPSFRTVKFKEGYNIILADRTKDSSKKDSRNGLGKTTLIEIIHFCLGSSLRKGSTLACKELDNWTFILDLTLDNKEFSIYRNTSNPSKVKIEGDFSGWVIKPEYEMDGNYMKVSDWNNVLGYLMFDIPIGMPQKKYLPTFRSLVSYFIRRGVGAFQSPFKHYPQQKEWDIQVNNAYLLGLNWEYASEFQISKDEGKALKDLKKASKEGLLTGYFGSLGELQAEKIGLEEKIFGFETELKNFKVHTQYHEIEEKANQLTGGIHKITNQTILDKQILKAYYNSISNENDVPIENVKKIYEQAGLLFPDNLKVKLNEVVDFHKQIISNRRDYLKYEIERIKRDIGFQESKLDELVKKRADLLEILEKHGALEEYRELNNRMVVLQQGLKGLKDRIKNLKTFEEGISKVKIQKQELLQKARRDFEERKNIIEKAIKLFNKNSNILYAEPGILSIDITEAGYKYKVEIKRAESQGVGYMKIFCYDLMLTRLIPTNKNKSGFLVHDSTIFDGVDERQRAKAMELANRESEERNVQYICAINSDVVPYSEFSNGFKSLFEKSIIIKFTDVTEKDGLLGIRF